jgi:hypothetical protein
LDTEDYTPKYSAAIKLAQLIVVQEVYKKKEEAIQVLQARNQEQEISEAECH